MLFLGAPLLGLAETVTLRGQIRDRDGLVLSEINLALTGQVAGETLTRSTTTDSDGAFSVDVPLGVWSGVPDEEDLLERGYFCVPGFLWDPDSDIPEGGIVIDNPGDIVLVFNPENIDMTAVPVMPTLTVKERSESGRSVVLEAASNFPRADQEPPAFTGTYVIEQSEDMVVWEVVDTVAMDSDSATTVDLVQSQPVGRCYYRSRRASVIVVNGNS